MADTAVLEDSSYPMSADEKRRRQKEFIQVLVFVVLTIGIGALTGAFTGLKTTFLYKEELHLSPSDVGTLGLILGIPSYIQPFIGAWTDMFAFFGYHRRSYYLAGKLVGVAGLMGLALTEHFHGLLSVQQHHYAIVVSLMLLIAAGGIVRTVIFNAIVVALGNDTGRFGQLQALMSLIPLVMGIAFTAKLGGVVAQNWSYPNAFMVAALLTLLSTPLVFLIDEKRSLQKRHVHESTEEHEQRLAAKRIAREETAKAMRQAFRSPSLWALVGFVFYLILTPGIFTVKVYYQTDHLHFSKLFLGSLGMFGAMGGLVAYVLFGVTFRRIPVYMLAWGAWLMDCLSYPSLLFLHNHISAIILEIFGAIVGALYVLCLNTLAARLCPRGLEGVVYGLVMAAIALAGNMSEKLGGMLYDFFGPAHHYTLEHGWAWSLYIGLAFTVVGGVFIPFLPRWTRSHKAIGDMTDEDVEGKSQAPAA